MTIGERVNEKPCRVHMWIGDVCGLCGAVGACKHCYGEWHVHDWLLPGEFDKPREGSR